MNNWRNWNFFVIWAPIVLFGIQTVFSFNKVREFLNCENIICLRWVILSLLVFYIINHFITVGRPFIRFTNFERTKGILFDQEFDRIIESVRDDEAVNIRINVMKKKFVLISFLEPSNSRIGRRIRWFTYHFKIERISANGVHMPDMGFEITQNQGIAGQAFNARGTIFALIDANDARIYNLNSQQLSAVENIVGVLSVPIRMYDFETHTLSDRIIGILNIDGSDDTFRRLLTDHELLDRFTERARALSAYCSLIS